jgi:DNA-binding Lrp family transcriptional regulator
MIAAYILIEAQAGALGKVAEDISEIEGLRSIEAVTGPYDAIAYAEAATPDDLAKLVVSRLQKVEGIQKTLTCMVVGLEAVKAA